MIIKCNCGLCGADFEVNTSHFAELGFSAFPKSCPSCKDQQGSDRKERILERNQLAYFGNVKLDFFPSDFWQESQAKIDDAKTPFRGHWDGANLSGLGSAGSDKSGSLTFYALKKYERGDTVSFRLMEVWNEREDGTRRLVEYAYLSEPEPSAPLLCLRETGWWKKTTLKGFGRQIDKGAPAFTISPEWSRIFSVGYRSGRAKTWSMWYIGRTETEVLESEEATWYETDETESKEENIAACLAALKHLGYGEE